MRRIGSIVAGRYFICQDMISARSVFSEALPTIVSNMSVPLLNMVDLFIVGHIEGSESMAAYATVAAIFNIFYWVFVFLRTYASGYTAQAYGAGNVGRVISILIWLVAVSSTVSAIVISCRSSILDMFAVFVDSRSLQAAVSGYYGIRIWMLPAFLFLMTLKGWFIGIKNMVAPMILTISASVLNLIFDWLFVLVLGMELDGLAYAAICAYGLTAIAGVGMAIHKYRAWFAQVALAQLLPARLDTAGLGRALGDNMFILCRSICILCVTSFVTFAGARMGNDVVAANAILLYFYTFFSYIINGFAYVGESAGGQCVGAGDAGAFGELAARLFGIGGVICCAVCVLYMAGGSRLTAFLTDNAAVSQLAAEYLPYGIFIPVVCFASFIGDGLLVGMTDFRALFLARIASTAIFFSIYFACVSSIGNHAIWLALFAYHAVSSAVPLYFIRRYANRSIDLDTSRTAPGREGEDSNSTLKYPE